MDDELLLLMDMMNEDARSPQPPTAAQLDGGTDITEAPEVEVTPEMRNQFPVVNNARGGGNRIQGVTNFLANPEVQNALIQFGQAFSNAGNFTGQPNPVDRIGQAGQGVIQGQANQAALEAFEAGEPIAESAGRFASPELVSTLQSRQQQEEQFEQELELQRRRTDLEERQLEQDTVFQTAQQSLDRELAESRIQNLERQAEVDQQMADARQAWWEAQAEVLGEGGRGSTENFALRTNEFIQVLGEQEQAISQEVNQIRDALSDLDVSVSEADLRGLASGEISPEDLDIGEADRGWWDIRGREAERQAEVLSDELDRALDRQQSVRNQRESIQNVQAARLSGQTTAEQREEQDEETGSSVTPQGSTESPVSVSSMQELNELPAGSVVDFFGTVGTLTESGNIRPLQQQEEENN